MTGESKTSIRKIAGVEKRQRAVSLRRGGASFDQIAKTMNCSRTMAYKMVSCELQKLAEETKEETGHLRLLELERLDRIFIPVYDGALGGDLPSVDRCLKIIDQRCKLLGLNMPVCIATTDSQGNDILVSREWLQIRAIVIDALDEAPGVKARVLEALAILETQQSGKQAGPAGEGP